MSEKRILPLRRNSDKIYGNVCPFPPPSGQSGAGIARRLRLLPSRMGEMENGRPHRREAGAGNEGEMAKMNAEGENT